MARLRSSAIRAGLAVLAGLLVASCYDGNDYIFVPFWHDDGVVVADFDGDGTPDIAVAQSYIDGGPPHAGYVAVYLQTAPGRFAAPVRYPVGPDPWALAAGDLDGSGHVDLVATTPNATPGMPNTGEISILRHDPAHPGAFLAAQILASGGGGDAVAIGDVTGDGRTDIVVADGSINAAHVILFAQGAAGAFATPLSISLGVNRGSNDVTIDDMDGDGRADIVMAVSDGAAILYDNGAGSFLSPVFVAAGINPQGIAVADLDADGRPDIVVSNAGYSFVGGTGAASVSVLRQTVAGSFASASIAVPDGAVQAVIADLNHDGMPDIGVLSFDYLDIDGDGPTQVSILRQSAGSAGSFSLASTYSTTLGGSFMAAGDVNGDGYTDLIVDNPPAVLLQRATAPGSFLAPTSL